MTGSVFSNSLLRSRERRAAKTLARMTALAVLAIGVGACNATSFTDGIGTASTRRPAAPVPPAGVGTETALAPEAQPTAPQNAASLQGGTQVAALPRIPPVAFLPVTGAPQSAVSQLASAMRNAAKSNSVPVVVSVERGAQYQLKGYFSALNDGSGSVLVYVWDVLDASGTRVHRISGQERGRSTGGDPWAGISDSMIDRVADTTMKSLRSWASTRRG